MLTTTAVDEDQIDDEQNAAATTTTATTPETTTTTSTPVSTAPGTGSFTKPPSGIIGSAMGYDPVLGSVDTKQTVSGQMDSLLSSDSQYLKRAQDLSKMQSNSRGLINSSMATQAGTAAAIDAAMPIAQQDASTFSKQAILNQDAMNSASVFNESIKLDQMRLDQDKLLRNMDTAARTGTTITTNFMDNWTALMTSDVDGKDVKGQQLMAETFGQLSMIGKMTGQEDSMDEYINNIYAIAGGASGGESGSSGGSGGGEEDKPSNRAQDFIAGGGIPGAIAKNTVSTAGKVAASTPVAKIFKGISSLF